MKGGRSPNGVLGGGPGGNGGTSVGETALKLK